MVKVTTKSGDVIELDTDRDTGYGFAPGDIVHFTKSLRNGKVALIRGTHDKLLWFSVHPSVDEATQQSALETPVDTVSCRVKAELLRQYGWVVDDKRNEYVDRLT